MTNGHWHQSGRLKKHHELLRKLAHEFGWICWYCGIGVVEPYKTDAGTERLDKHRTASIDHVVPKTVGGSDDYSNMALACITCNRAKFTSNVNVFIEWLDHVAFAPTERLILRKISRAL